MRLFTILLALVSTAASFASQAPFVTNPSTQSTTLIDALSADPDYTSLLKLLQRALLVPTLNKLNGSTLFAPTNDAIEKHPSWSEALTIADDVYSARDNVQQKLRQDLLYHLLNYSIQVLPEDDNPQVHKTLHFPRKESEPPSREPPPNPPWLPVPGGTLGGEPQRLRVYSDQGKVLVGTDAFGEGGSKVVKGEVDAGNGMLFGIDSVLQVPPDLASVASQQHSLSYFNKIINPDIISLLNATSKLTLFLPVDSAWDALPDIERKYLESKFATDDILQILNMHAVVTEGVHWSDSFKPSSRLTTISGSTLEIITSPESGKTLISSAELLEPDIYASNGVLHTVSSLLIPPGAFNITPEKYLLTLNCTTFVSKLHSVDLTPLINDTSVQYTILAPSDDVLALSGDDDLPDEGSDELKRTLSYHFLPGKWTPKKLKDGALVETALEEVGLDGGRQVLDITISGNNDKRDKASGIRFGGASVIGEYLEIENTVIYLISRPLAPPADALTTALPSLELSQYLAAVFSTSLADRLKTTPRTTFMIPVNDGFKRLGTLVSRYLLSASSKADLENVIQHHILDGVEYAKSLQNGSQKSYPTLEGSDVRAERAGNGSVSISASGGWTGMRSSVAPANLLTRTGIIHELSDVLLPRSVDLTIGKLVKAADGSTMTSLIVRAGMDWILNGTAPPEGSPWAEVAVNGNGWTLLCPTDDAFKGFELTRLYNESDVLRSIVEQHLIPVSKPQALQLANLDPAQTNRPILLDDAATYTTVRSNSSAYGDIVFRWIGDDDGKGGTGYFVGIKDARGKAGEDGGARVLSWGRTTSNGGVGGVIQIDAVLVPYRPPWWLEYGAPIGVGVIGIALILLFFLGVRALWRRDTTEATYEPLGGFTNNDDEEP
ncbi:FAS1 domain-containing protein [Fomitiporia mediterranea MF3/22]|uniref:FAS1 domain-containing protein n=1 Tax=Fomitiporia mediterranea (strain MF3/22) TaxID=694068 RepID=UPI0004407280|nr:FAS1 domain-containing protein [Fomitiporia mediterranea MF3/22]EJD03820.1 FAS1 domain-containing protein [Fomitiporia mediterranea MF3/22]